MSQQGKVASWTMRTGCRAGVEQSLLTQDSQQYQLWTASAELLVVDEAHRIKRHTSNTVEALKKIKMSQGSFFMCSPFGGDDEQKKQLKRQPVTLLQNIFDFPRNQINIQQILRFPMMIVNFLMRVGDP